MEDYNGNNQMHIIFKYREYLKKQNDEIENQPRLNTNKMDMEK